jgi:centrin-1
MQTSYTVSKVTTTTSKPTTQVVNKRSNQPVTVSTNKSGTQVVSSQRQVITTSSTSSSRPTNQVVTQKTTTTVTTTRSGNKPVNTTTTSQVVNKRSQNTTTTTTVKNSVSPQKQTTTKTTVQVNNNRNKTVPVKVQPTTQTSQVKVNVQTSHRAASKPVTTTTTTTTTTKQTTVAKPVVAAPAKQTSTSKPTTTSKPTSTSKPSSQAPTKKVEIQQERHYTYNPELDGDKIREAFELFDSNDGRLNAQEVRDAMQNIGYDETNPAIFQVVTELDTNRNKKEGGATFNEFCETVNYRIPEKETNDDLRKIFELFIDDPQTETTSLESIKRVADELGENIREDELNAMLNKASKAGARLTFEDFVAIMKESF